jgi:hypothetical protein
VNRTAGLQINKHFLNQKAIISTNKIDIFPSPFLFFRPVPVLLKNEVVIRHIISATLLSRKGNNK